ncbi:uncharacterized protein C8R40DRAFT_70354 [Lentinula edodes]|uniref:uncharacterized protein n=1 Tax=Lentinula edodes TaxID=5353 RepID=UPI001E8E76FD|nr:uncharacterized protein C8R40DRAFT_70354 [Lentinula edodes]KAH7877338.1 hypothetical protein C8R40DRAFT_70354 [Lentinula edodes]
MDRIVAAQQQANRRDLTLRKLEDNLSPALSCKFPVSFNAEGVQRCQSQSDAIKLVGYFQRAPENNLEKMAEELTLDEGDGEDERELSSIYQAHGNINSDSISVYSTPSKRQKGRSNVAKSWLLGWLIHVGLLHCHISHTTPYANLLIQLAHVLLPNATKTTDHILTFYEFILGMPFRSLCIHSRLFLIPLRNNLHSAFDDHLFIILPHLELLKAMVLYFEAVVGRRTRRGKERQSMWVEMRNGTLPGFDKFTDGSIFKCILIPHPSAITEVQEDLAYPGFLFTHTSPFALLLNAFRSLHVWATHQGLRGTDGLSCLPSEMLITALRKLPIRDIEASNIVTEVKNIYESIQDLLTLYHGERGKAWLAACNERDKAGGPKRGNGGNGNSGDSGGAGSSPDAFNRRLQEHGLQALEFSGGTGSSSGAMQAEPQEGMVVSLLSVEVGSVWSADSLDHGIVAARPGVADSCDGLSPAQQIANGWNSAIPEPLGPLHRSHTPSTTTQAQSSSLTVVGEPLGIAKTSHVLYQAIKMPSRVLLKRARKKMQMVVEQMLGGL